ncbi:hypothetical protein EYF80_002226 [Liparis tanakae]|uniref:Uncharacterized protein n=1 Tax=Liparis tanakae TaxID=230148 RepID=A0A4Z2JBB5_9TELE|nr:hypothetical protein EYF80_002226 [Liparis tanakae]
MEDMYQQTTIIGEMQLPEGFAQNCIMHDEKVNTSEDAQKIQARRIETLEKDLCGAKASVTVQTELMENTKIKFDNILNLERLENKRLTVKKEKLRRTPALKNTSDQETLNIYQQKTDKLKKDLWKWKQRVTSLQGELHTARCGLCIPSSVRGRNTIADMTQQSTVWMLEVQDATKDLENERIALQRDLHTAQVNITDLLETNASLNVAVNRVPLDHKAPDNTQVVLEKNTFLKTELHTAKQKLKDQLEEANALAESLCRWKQRVTAVTQEKVGLELENTSLLTDRHTAQSTGSGNHPAGVGSF